MTSDNNTSSTTVMNRNNNNHNNNNNNNNNDQNGPLLVVVGVTSALVGAGLAWMVQNLIHRYRHHHPLKFRIPRALLVPSSSSSSTSSSSSSNESYSKELIVAVRMALQAGKNLMAHYNSKGTADELSEHDLGIHTKSTADDFCTAVDLWNEKIIIDAIHHFFPSHRIIGEESVGTGTLPELTNDPTWIIDPIDGTTNFAAGLPLVCVSIGLVVNRQTVMGVVYAPMTDELYLSVRGRGAYRNGVKITMTEKPIQKLSDAVLNFEFGYARETEAISRMTRAVENILTHGCRTTRTLGSGVLDLCYVATGRMDVVYCGVANEGWKPWDYCAGNVIVEEAGGVMESLYDQKPGQGFDLFSKSMICATSKQLLEETRAVVTKGLEKK